ncbi:MAG TPA: hypothetical protein VGF91_08745 [Solirubrobacteraceae bacterium]
MDSSGIAGEYPGHDHKRAADVRCSLALGDPGTVDLEMRGGTPKREDLAYQAAVEFIAGAAFPRLAYRLRWPVRLRGWRLVAYIAFNTLLLFAVRAWVVPYFRDMAVEREHTRRHLRAELGREPTDDEVVRRQVLGRPD